MFFTDFEHLHTGSSESSKIYKNRKKIQTKLCKPAQRETPPNTDPYSPDMDCVLPYKAIRSPYRENTGSVFGGGSRCAGNICFAIPMQHSK